jgi:N,N'-diacetyllegionaminate synthase
MTVRIGKRELGDKHPCFITYEAGPTHDGLESAKHLVKLAADAGADAIKFQIFDPDKLVADKTLLFSYEVLLNRETGESETITEPLYDILCRRYLDPDEWKEVKKLSDGLGLAFFATVGFEEDVALLESLGCDSIKIASADVNHWPLIRRVARTRMCVQLDTGNATIGEVEDAVEVCRSEGNESIIIHNCPSGYPARLESINLRLIPTLKLMFPDYPIAYSDHTPGWEMDVAAVALGAKLVEKTITKDRMTRSVEHIFSLEPFEMKQFVQTIRSVETALGSSRRILHPEEEKKRKSIRRSAFLKRAVHKGSYVSLEDIEFRRPGFGIAPSTMESLCGMRYTQDYAAGHRLSLSDMVE